MRSRLLLTILGLYLAIAVSGCSRKPSTDSGNAAGNAASNSSSQPAADNNAAPAETREAKPEPLVVPARTMLTVRLGSALGSKLSQPGETFTGTVAKDVMVGDAVEEDLDGARALGMRAILLDRAGRHPEIEPRIEDLRALPAALGLPGSPS